MYHADLQADNVNLQGTNVVVMRTVNAVRKGTAYCGLQWTVRV